jgi:hypothetical protein
MSYRTFITIELILSHLGCVIIGLALAQHNLWLVR